MMKKDKKNLEFYGSSPEDAINNALKELKVSREDIFIKVVCEEKKGLFGMEGEKPAKIIVKYKKDIKI